jgi:hypothetical protein
VKLEHLLRRAALEADRAAVRERGGLIIDRFRNAERAAVVPIEKPIVPGGSGVLHRRTDAQNAQYSIVEALRALDIVGTDHHVTEHCESP